MAAGEKRVVGISDRWFENSTVLVVVVAVATEGIDWAAYQDAASVVSWISGLEGNNEGADTSYRLFRDLIVARAIDTGDKLSEREARAYFPNVELPYRI